MNAAEYSTLNPKNMHCTIPQRDQNWTLHLLLQLNLQGKSENTWQSQIKSPAESWLCGHCQYINYFLLMWKLYDSSRFCCVIFLSSHIKMTADGAYWCKELIDQGFSFMSKLHWNSPNPRLTTCKKKSYLAECTHRLHQQTSCKVTPSTWLATPAAWS